MGRSRKYTVVYAPETVGHLDTIESKYHSLIRRTINEQLSQTPDNPTRNRKPLKEVVIPEATWELRFGPGSRFRVFYEVDVSQKRVQVLAIGVKVRNRLVVGREEIEL